MFNTNIICVSINKVAQSKYKEIKQIRCNLIITDLLKNWFSRNSVSILSVKQLLCSRGTLHRHFMMMCLFRRNS